MYRILTTLALIFLVTSCGNDGNYTYEIVDNRGHVFYANFYNKSGDGCLMFNNKPGRDNGPGNPTVICGNYSIYKIK